MPDLSFFFSSSLGDFLSLSVVVCWYLAPFSTRPPSPPDERLLFTSVAFPGFQTPQLARISWLSALNVEKHLTLQSV